jgi:hypothetical protein
MSEYVQSLRHLASLVALRRCVEINYWRGWHRIPAAFVINWQGRELHKLFEQRRLRVYHKCIGGNK